jgi:hypothetical protein
VTDEVDPLSVIANQYGTDKGHKHKSPYGQSLVYTPVYHKLFQHLRDKEFHMLEIGVAEGFSMHTWLDYFPKAIVHGWEIDLAHTRKCDSGLWDIERLHLQHVDETSADSLKEAYEAAGRPTFEIVIDDAMHLLSAHLTSLSVLLPALSPTGYWIIEDLSDGRADPVTSFMLPPGYENTIIDKWPDWHGYMQIIRRVSHD